MATTCGFPGTGSGRAPRRAGTPGTGIATVRFTSTPTANGELTYRFHDGCPQPFANVYPTVADTVLVPLSPSCRPRSDYAKLVIRSALSPVCRCGHRPRGGHGRAVSASVRRSVDASPRSGGQNRSDEALDTRTHAVVALERPSAQPRGPYRFKHEFRALTDVQHQNLVQGELTCEDGNWFFTMELVSGTSFIHHAGRARPEARSDDVLRRGERRDADRHGILRGRLRQPLLEQPRLAATWAPPSMRSACARRCRRSSRSQIMQAATSCRDVKPSNVMVLRGPRRCLTSAS